MKTMLSFVTLAGLLMAGGLRGPAQTNSPTMDLASVAQEKQTPSLDKHLKPVLDALQLKDPAQEARVREVLTKFFADHADWHQANDVKLKGLWNNFNRARSKQDQAAAGHALAAIDSIYATFKPQHERFLAGLGTVLSPKQIETVEDVLTVKKVEATYHAYLEIFPGLTDEQKSVILKNLQAAREEAVDAGSMAEKSAFFKKYKIKIEEDYLTAQGYDPKQARKDFAAKQAAGGVKTADTNNAAQ